MIADIFPLLVFTSVLVILRNVLEEGLPVRTQHQTRAEEPTAGHGQFDKAA